jgi:hypothetical protein
MFRGRASFRRFKRDGTVGSGNPLDADGSDERR